MSVLEIFDTVPLLCPGAIVLLFLLLMVPMFFDAFWDKVGVEVETEEFTPMAIPYRPSQRQHKAGFVYLIRDVEVTGHYKIGRTINPHRRFRDFGAKWPFRTELIWFGETDDCAALETELHRQYASKRVRGEWFALDDDDIAAIRRLA